MLPVKLRSQLIKGSKLTIIIASLALIGCWTSWDSIKPLSALIALDKPDLKALNPDDDINSHKLRRSIQKHFLNYDVYIPLEDIVLAQETTNYHDHLTFLMRKACGQAKLYVWIPLKIRLPYFGSKTWEWCWKQS